MYNDFGTFPDRSTPSTPAIISSYHDTLIRAINAINAIISSYRDALMRLFIRGGVIHSHHLTGIIPLLILGRSGDQVGSTLPYICGGRWSGVLDYIRRSGLTLAALWPLEGALRCLSC